MLTDRVNKILQRVIRRLAYKNYYTARAHYHHKLAQCDRKYSEPPLLVYQMGKVGSKTVIESLKALEIDRRIYHFHMLRPDRIGEYENWRKKFFGSDNSRLEYVWKCQYIRKQIEHGLDGKKWKIITLVRDPIARNLSDFFQNIKMEQLANNQQWKLKGVGSEVSPVYDFEITVNNLDTKELIEIFLKKYRHYDPLKWFDREFLNILDIDIYASDFRTSKGYKIYEEKEAVVLLLRLENFNDCAAEAFKEFLDIDDLALVNTNVGSKKYHAQIYEAFKNAIVFPEAYLDKIYSSKFAQQFYSQAEIEKFRAKWCGNKLTD